MENKVLDGNFFKLVMEETDGKVIAPTERREGKVNFEEVREFDEINTDYINTKKPAKEIPFPQNDELIKYGREWIEEIPEPEEEKIIVLGIRPCDAKAMLMLDEIFTDKSEDYSDPYYEVRRNNTVLVGLACNEAGRNCFCTSVGGSPHGTEGLDILVTDLGGKHHVQILSEKGNQLVSSLKGLQGETEEDDKKKGNLEDDAIESFARRIVDAESLPDELRDIFENDYWNEVSFPCIGCGICTFLCPTCYCFNITDEGEREGRRVKSWDSCQFPNFTLESSSRNPRDEKSERLKNRFYDKYRYMHEEKGMIFCVGCGRCIDECPAGVDIVNVMNGVHDLEGAG